MRYLGGVIATVLALSPVSASAAELRITLPELANALQSVMGDAKLHQPGIAVGAAALIGHPMWAEIAFLEHMHGDAAGPGQFDGLRMDRPRIAI